MRIRFRTLLVLGTGSACLGLACHSGSAPEGESGSASAAASVEASADAKPAVVAPTLGGNVVVVGSHPVELAIAENGFVQGLVYDDRGRVMAGAAPQVSVALRTKGGGRPRASLAWSASHARLEGRAQLEAGLSAEPIDVALALADQHASATLRDYAILPFARFGGSVLAAGPYAVELLVQGAAVTAYVLDSSGKALQAGDVMLQLRLGAGAEHEFALKWEAARGCYTGLLGQLEVSGQPLALALTASGKTYTGAAASLQALAAARLDARAQLQAGASTLPAAGAGASRSRPSSPAAELDAALGAGARAAGEGRARLDEAAQARVKAGTAALSRAKASVSVAAPGVKVKKSASASASTKRSSSQVKASAGVKAGVRLGL